MAATSISLPMRLCCAPGCGVVVRSGRCKQHETAKEQQRGTSRERGYTYRWSLYSKQWLQRRPVCGMREDMSLDTTNSRCAAAGMTTVARCVDHTVPISRGGSMFDPSNHMSACIACNSAKGDR